MFLSVSWQVLGESSRIDLKENILSVGLVGQPQTPREIRPEDTSGGISFDIKGRLSDSYIDQMKAKIFHTWVYPMPAILNGYDGTSVISFSLDDMGGLLALGLIRSSGHEGLDRAAMDAIRAASPFGPITEDIGPGKLKITASFRYVLE